MGFSVGVDFDSTNLRVVMPMYEEVKHKLQSYRYCLQRIDKNIELIAELRSRAEKITTSYSLAPSGGLGDSLANAAAKITDLEREIAKDTAYLKEAMTLVLFMISTLDDYQQRSVLDYRYIYGYSWGKIRAELHYSRTQVYEIHMAALKNLSQIIKSEQK